MCAVLMHNSVKKRSLYVNKLTFSDKINRIREIIKTSLQLSTSNFAVSPPFRMQTTLTCRLFVASYSHGGKAINSVSASEDITNRCNINISLESFQ